MELILNDEEQELRNSIQNEIEQISQELQSQQAEEDYYSECVANSAPGDEGDC